MFWCVCISEAISLGEARFEVKVVGLSQGQRASLVQFVFVSGASLQSSLKVLQKAALHLCTSIPLTLPANPLLNGLIDGGWLIRGGGILRFMGTFRPRCGCCVDRCPSTPERGLKMASLISLIISAQRS